MYKKLAPLEVDVPVANLHPTLGSTKTITHKRDLLDALRRSNPASVNTAPSIFWDVEGGLKTSNIDDSDVKQQMTIVENGVNYNVKRYNDLKVMNDRLTRELKARLDELENQKKSFEAVDAMKKAETEEGKRIEMLHKEINDVENHIRERTHYARKLDHMLGRLKRNQLKFDAHMVGMEDTMRSIQKDGTDVRLMRRGLDAGLAKAKHVYEETKARLTLARKDRDSMMEQRRVEYKNAVILQRWLIERARMKAELGVELRGDLTVEEENFLRAQIDERMEKTKNLQKAAEEGLKKLQQMEEAFTKLKQVTGVKNVEEMHEKFSNQRSNKLQLEMEVKDAEHRLATAKKAFQKQEQIFQELKSSGIESAELNRDNIKRLEELYNEARNDQKAIKADSDRIAAVLLGLHQGSQGLLQRIQPYLHLTEGGVFELTQLGEETAPWTETVDALTTAEHVLTKMMEAIAGDSAAPGPGGYDEDEDNDSTYSRDSHSVETLDEAPNFANNVRIRSKKVLRDLENEEDGTPAVVGGGGNAYTADKEEVEGLASNLTGAENAAADALLHEDIVVPGRTAVKTLASRRTQEAKRKEEMAIRRKKLMDRMMESKSSKNAGGDDSNFGLTAQFKAQKAAADRLSTTAKPPTLPDGVTLRDDPMTKTIAFLSSAPDLA
eukprot:gene8374-9229_t